MCSIKTPCIYFIFDACIVKYYSRVCVCVCGRACLMCAFVCLYMCMRDVLV